jgi:hypothetical protein
MGSRSAFQLVRDFDRAWGRGETPDIGEYLQDYTGSDRTQLFGWLLAKDLTHRAIRHLILDATAYVERFPEYRAMIEEACGKSETRDGEDTPTASSPAPPIPVSIPGHELLEIIGEGGQGTVYRARELATGTVVAVKIGRVGIQSRDRFRAEAEIAARLDHPGIVRVTGVGDAGGVPYMRMEFVRGMTLEAACRVLLDGGPRHGAILAATCAADIADALAHAHGRGVIHRDLKPQNVILTRDLRVKLTDFGSAKDELLDRGLTTTAGLMGTPAYMAPEQLRGEPVTVATDIYGLGAILYYALCGSSPFTGSTFEALRERILRERPAAPPADDPLTAMVWPICRKCLEKEPGDRYLSASLVAQDLRAVLRGDLPVHVLPGTELPPTPPIEPPPPVAAPTRRERLLWSLVAAAAATAFWAALGDRSQSLIDAQVQVFAEVGIDLPPLLRQPLLHLLTAACLAGIFAASWPREAAAAVRVPFAVLRLPLVPITHAWQTADRSRRGRLGGSVVLAFSAAWLLPLVAVTVRWAIRASGGEIQAGWMEWVSRAAVLGGMGGLLAGLVCGFPGGIAGEWARTCPLEWALPRCGGALGMVTVGAFLGLCVRCGARRLGASLDIALPGEAVEWAFVGAFIGYCAAVTGERLWRERPTAAVLFRALLHRGGTTSGGTSLSPLTLLAEFGGGAAAGAGIGAGLGWILYRPFAWVLAENGLVLPGERGTLMVVCALCGAWFGLSETITGVIRRFPGAGRAPVGPSDPTPQPVAEEARP